MKGERRRNEKLSQRINSTGKYRSVKAPPEMLRTRHCPHLAFLDEQAYDELIEMLDQRNAPYRRAKDGQRDPRKGTPRKRTVWPAQHMCCGVCGRVMYCQGPKDGRILICSGATEYKCWNSVALNLDVAGSKLLDALLTAIAELPDFAQPLREQVAASVEQVLAQRDGNRRRLDKELEQLRGQLQRVVDAIAKVGSSDTLADKLKDLEQREREVKADLRQLDQRPKPAVALPEVAELRSLARDALGDLQRDSPELGRVLQSLIPQLYAYTYQLVDCTKIVLRATVEFDISSLIPTAAEVPAVATHLQHQLVVDLFDPPQRAKYRAQICDLTRSDESLTEKKIAEHLGLTQTAVQDAKALHRQLDRIGRDDPYIPVTAPPDQGRMRRHRHERYEFSALPGHKPVWPTA